MPDLHDLGAFVRGQTVRSFGRAIDYDHDGATVNLSVIFDDRPIVFQGELTDVVVRKRRARALLSDMPDGFDEGDTITHANGDTDTVTATIEDGRGGVDLILEKNDE